MAHWIDTTGTLDLWQVAAAYLLLAGCLTALPLALWTAIRQGRGQPLGVAALVVVAGAAVVRLVVDGRIATVFIGYKATQQAVELFPVPHYGAGVSVLYHQLLLAFGVDHRVILTANAVMGALTLPLLMAWVHRMTASARAALLVGVLVALTPLLVRNDASDANNVPCLMWTFCGLVLLGRAWAEPNRWPLWWAGFPLALAVVGRPEWVALAGGLGLVTLLAHPARPPLRRLSVDALLLAPFAALTVPHFIHVSRAADALARGGNIEPWERMLGFPHNVLQEPGLFGVGTTAAAVLGSLALWRTHRRWMLSLWAVVGLGLMIYSVDLDRANLPRVQVPVALVTTVLAGHALSLLRGRAAVVAATALVLATHVPAATTLWQPTNEDQEEALIREALAAIEAPGFTLLRLNHPDPDPAERGHTHYHFPDYLVMTPARRGRVAPLSAWGTAELEGPVYFLRGLRCYARFRTEEEAAPEGRTEHPLCKRLASEGTPVFEREVPNYGDVWINYYGTAPTLTVGLYRLQ